MKEIILFIITFILIYLIYHIFIIGKAKRRNSKKKPMEVQYLESKYKIDIKKLNYKKLLNLVSLVSSLDTAIIITIVLLIDSYLIEILVALLLVVPVIMISYGFVGKYYVKRGMIKDE